jgi:hypothetical protein
MRRGYAPSGGELSPNGAMRVLRVTNILRLGERIDTLPHRSESYMGDDENARLQMLEDLTLLLIYLTSWREKIPGGYMLRVWKGYEFSVLNALTEKGLLHESKRAKSVYLTDEGVARAKKLMA